MTDTKAIENVRITGGSMFDFMQPFDAGVVIKENKKFKISKLDYDQITGKMSKESYNKRINVRKFKLKINFLQEGNFMSKKIHPEI